MASIKTEQRQRSKNLNEMQRSYNAAEWLIRDKVEQLDWLLYKLHQEDRTLGVETWYIQSYIREKVTAMIDEVAALREEEERQGVRGRKRG
ncbi:hypothetical protein A3842_11050 [Paenibacillus sp. P3E]|uniref:hypothetical protein n=1 Tax=Paenibacillus sp. P3E TaxID=1349435 RepID=UPI00096684B5|nr:hypothetical protein [Paenibacillus sp. P3E]OKP81610.1 hypothetical protein A3842_11050 [Paenibacillus sp. P3E]